MGFDKVNRDIGCAMAAIITIALVVGFAIGRLF